MDNQWVTRGDDFAEWVADLTPAAADPPALLAWLRTLLAAGEEQQVYRLLESPLAGYRRERDGELDLGHFASSGVRPVDGVRLRVSARLAHHGPDGRVVEGEVENLGALLRSLHPAEAAVSGFLALDCPPLDLSGPLLDLAHPERSRWRSLAGTVLVRLAVRSDIWFPAVDGLLVGGEDDRRVDNSALAARHTPRLNAFLAQVHAATEAVGGRWEVDDEISGPGPVSEDGIVLDG